MRKLEVVSILLLTIAFLSIQADATACHSTNKWQLKKSIESKFDNNVVWGEIGGKEYAEIVLRTLSMDPSSTFDVLARTIVHVTTEMAKKLGKKAAGQLLHDIMHNPGRVRPIVTGQWHIEAGRQLWSRKECISCDPDRLCTSLPATNAFYVAWRFPSSDGDSSSAVIDQQNCGNIELQPTSSNLEFRRGKSWTTCSGYKFIFQDDANLVLYRPDGRPVWATGTSGGANLFAVQADGNIVLYDSGRPVWATDTSGKGNFFAIQSDGNLVVYTSSGRPLWSSDTHSGKTGSRNASGEWLSKR